MKITKLRLLGVLVGSIFVVAACSGPTGGASPTASVSPLPTATAAIDGQPLYGANCASCHGGNAAGGMKLGTATAADIRGPALAARYQSDVTLIKQSILSGKGANNKDLDATMPRWSGRLSDAQVTAIVQYLLTLK